MPNLRRLYHTGGEHCPGCYIDFAVWILARTLTPRGRQEIRALSERARAVEQHELALRLAFSDRTLALKENANV